MPSMSLGIESLKKWVDYWRKFKGKKVRVWFIIRDGNVLGHFYCSRSGTLQPSVPFSGRNQREVAACPCIDGTIQEVIDSPFGLMLNNISTWRLIGAELRPEFSKSSVAEETSTEVSSMFIPVSEIARIDFLNKTNKNLVSASTHS